MDRSTSRAARAALAGLVIALGLSGRARADVYLSLGDSLAFGETIFTTDAATYGPYADPSLGDRGYVGMYADYLKGQDGGVRPDVINLAIPGETLSSFGSGAGRVPPAAGITDAQLAQANLNYDAPGAPTTQAALLGTTLSAHAGDIKAITVSLGSNDLFALALTDPNAAADLPGALAAFKAGYESLVNGLHAAAPNAVITLVGSYNPFTADPSSPFAGLAGLAIPYLNATVAAVAADTGAYFASLYDTDLTNHADTFTLITTAPGDVHPYFDKGYNVIATAIEAVPEPSSFALAGLGLGGLGLLTVRRRRLAALGTHRQG